MIGTKLKDTGRIEKMAAPYSNFYLIGCGDCATVCKTGGEEEVKNFASYLQSKNKVVTGYSILDEACDARLAKKLFRQEAEKIKSADCVLVFACGSGVQTVAELTDKPVLPVLDSIFAGGIENLSKFRELCSVCGDCTLDLTAGICPITRCPKGIFNGPCGGSDKGKCEENPDMDCVWYLIYSKLKQQNKLDNLRKLFKFKNHRNFVKPRKIEIKR